MAKAISGVEPRTPDEMFDDVATRYVERHGADDIDTLRRAYQLAYRLHDGQYRATGDPYITHPLAVAEILAGYGMDEATLVAALLHDVVEDTEMGIAEIEEVFGEETSGLIDGVTKLDRIKFSTREEHQAATIRKMAVAMAKDIRVLLIKLADRTHNMRTITPLPEPKQRRVASETLDVYAPLAHRLGVQEIKHELEERCFAVLYPKVREELEDQMRRRAPERENYIEKAVADVSSSLEDVGVEATVSGRPKHLYSIYRKMATSGLLFEEIHDLIGIRIIVEEVRDCYAVLGQIHTMWPPIQGRFKDYIAMPKFNLYQSLHTTVVGPDGKPLEVQIRTREMHERAEYGIASHWRYKEGEETTAELPIVADIRFIQDATEDPADFLSNLKLDLYQDEVFALTPKGDVISLPRGATPVDFAYRIHTDVGHHTAGAKIDGRLVPLSTEIESGDIVEIITSKAKDARPSRDWLDFVSSSRASAKIRQFFAKQRRERALAVGKDAVAKALRRDSLPVHGHDDDLTEVAADMGFDELDRLYSAVGDGRISPQTVTNRLARRLDVDTTEEEEILEQFVSPTPRRTRPSRGVIVEGLDDVLVRMARCCSPVPGDDIIGFVTVGRGVSVHRSDCANMGSLEEERAERLIEVAWAPEQTDSFFVWLQVEAIDRPKLLRDVTMVLADLGANIHASSSVTSRDRVALLRYEIEISDPNVLERALEEIRSIDGVYDAYRLLPRADRS